MTETLAEVVDAIRAAFAGVRRGVITLHEAEVIDRYGDDDERARARRLDTESSWEQVSDAAIEECPWALPHLDALSWRYYLPARMVWSLRHSPTSDSMVTDFTIYACLTKDGDLADYHAERFRTLDRAQSRAVCLFLRYMAAHDGDCDGDAARRALERTWGCFCE